MAHIIGFEIDGLVGRAKPFSARLNRDVNIFYGLNGSGKTSLLKILYSALSADVEPLRNLPFKRAQVRVYLNKFRKPFTRSIVQVQPESPPGEPEQLTLLRDLTVHHDLDDDVWIRSASGEHALAWTTDPAEPDGPGLTTYRKGYLPISRLYRNLTTPTGARRLSDKELDNAFARGIQTQWTEYYADISKEVTQVQERGFAEILGFLLSGQVNDSDSVEAPHVDEAYDRIKSFLGRQPAYSHFIPNKKDFSKIYSQRRELQNVVKQIEIVERRINAVSAPRERFREVLESMYSGEKHLVFTEKEIQVGLPGSKQIGLSLLSSGEKQLLFIAFHVLTGGNSSVIVDEPELSMHVDWQKRLVSTLNLLNSDVQLILATHSPEIMADIPDSKIFSL